ncbi:hypothetical protein KR018_010917, partial [Drosophila ironensis]
VKNTRSKVNFKGHKSLSPKAAMSVPSLAAGFKETKDAAEINLELDLDRPFFESSYDLVQSLSSRDPLVAAKFKYYVDILSRLHSHYTSELAEGKINLGKIQSADEKLQLALQTTATSEAMMEKLRESLEDAWRSEDAAKMRQERAQQQLQEHTKKDQSLIRSSSVDDAHEVISAREAQIRRLVYRERDRLSAELEDYVKRLQMNRVYSESLEAIIEANKEAFAKLHLQMKMVETENYQLEHKSRITAEKYEEQILELAREMEALATRNMELSFKEKQVVEVTAANEALKLRIERLLRENHTITKSMAAQEDDRLKLQKNLKIAEDLNSAQRREIAELETGRKIFERDIKKKMDDSMLLERRFIQIQKKNTDLMDQALVNQNEIKVQEKKISMAHSRLEEALNQRDDMARIREKLRMEIVRLNDVVNVVKHEIAVVRRQMLDMQDSLYRANKKLDDKDLLVQKVQREKRELSNEVNEAFKKIEGLEENLLKKTERLESIQVELQQQHSQYVEAKKQMEIIHSDKVMLMKTMDMCSRDRNTLQNTMAKLSHQIHQLTTTVALNEKEIITLRNQIDQQSRAIKQKQNEIHSKGRLLTNTRSELREMKIRVEQSQHSIDADVQRFKSLACALDEVNKEKSLVGMQMVRRNDEVRLLKERITMMQIAIDSGTLQYKQRLEDIRLLKLEVVNLRLSHECMQREVGNKASLRKDVIRLERQLIQEKLKVTAYMEELSIPCRIHRWRVLLGKDPRRFELIRKVQTLLRRNIKLSLERENMSKKLEDSVRLYEGLKRTIKHMPDPSVREKLCVQQRINRRQDRRLKAVTAELRINEIEMKARERLIEGFQEQLRQNHLLNAATDVGASGDGIVKVTAAPDERCMDTIIESSATSDY